MPIERHQSYSAITGIVQTLESNPLKGFLSKFAQALMLPSHKFSKKKRKSPHQRKNCAIGCAFSVWLSFALSVCLAYWQHGSLRDGAKHLWARNTIEKPRGGASVSPNENFVNMNPTNTSQDLLVEERPVGKNHWSDIPDTLHDLLITSSIANIQNNGKTHPRIWNDFTEIQLGMATLLDRVNWQVRDPHFKDKNKSAIIIGQPNIMKRDGPLLMDAYMTRGVDVQQVSEITRGAVRGLARTDLRAVRHRDWGVILCLSLDTDACFPEAEFVRIENEYTRINRIPGLKRVLWSKDRFCDAMKRSGEWMNLFTFPCYVLPLHSEEFIRVSQENQYSWIVKPYKQGGGNGIFVIDDTAELFKITSNKYVVQPYLQNPHLINGKKWDIRTYVLVTGIHPVMRSYVYHDGLVRFASQMYNPHASNGGNRSQFLTNVSVNKKVESNVDTLTWSFEQLESHIGLKEYKKLNHRIRLALGMMLVRSERYFRQVFAKLGKDFTCYNCYHLLGVDIIVDDQFFPRIVEVNGEPSMQLSNNAHSRYDAMKHAMQQEVSKIVLNPVTRVAKATLARLNKMKLSENEKYWVQQNREFILYALQFLREQENREGFQSVYPDELSCNSLTRQELWRRYLDDLYTKFDNMPERRMAHNMIARLACE